MTLKSPLDCKEIKPVNPKGNQSWIFIGSTEAKTPILWPPDVQKWLTGKDPDAGKDWRQEEGKGTTEDEIVEWHHRLDGHEFEQDPGVSDGTGKPGVLLCMGVAKCRTQLSDQIDSLCGLRQKPQRLPPGVTSVWWPQVSLPAALAPCCGADSTWLTEARLCFQGRSSEPVACTQTTASVNLHWVAVQFCLASFHLDGECPRDTFFPSFLWQPF